VSQEVALFFDDPELLFGIPLVIIGVFGLLIAGAALIAPEPGAPVLTRRAGHPDESEYVRIGLILAVITAVEVVIYYFDIPRNLFILILVALSAAKFTLVVMFFMHLKFDSRLFTTAFVTGFVLAASVFTVVIATLGSNIV
jgi:cytochrome c oxidase subunit 4